MNRSSVEVSVVIPTYNRARFVGEAIDSVVSQQVPGLEIIVVDDGSTDETEKALQPYVGKVEILRQGNAGVSAARNAGLSIARGQWVAFLDSDDRWERGKLRSQLQDLKASGTAIAHVVNTRVFRDFAYDADLFSLGGLRIRAGSLRTLKRPLKPFLRHNFARVQSTIIRRDALDRAGHFNEEYSILEDWDLLCRVALEGPWLVRNEILVHEIRRPEPRIGLGLQRSDDPEGTCRTAIEVLLNLLKNGRLSADEHSASLSLLAKRYRWLTSILIEQGRQQEARRAALDSLEAHVSLRGIARLLTTFVPY